MNCDSTLRNNRPVALGLEKEAGTKELCGLLLIDLSSSITCMVVPFLIHLLSANCYARPIPHIISSPYTSLADCAHTHCSLLLVL